MRLSRLSRIEIILYISIRFWRNKWAIGFMMCFCGHIKSVTWNSFVLLYEDEKKSKIIRICKKVCLDADLYAFRRLKPPPHTTCWWWVASAGAVALYRCPVVLATTLVEGLYTTIYCRWWYSHIHYGLRLYI